MKTLHLVKKFKHQTPEEERTMAGSFKRGRKVIDIIKKYLEMEVLKQDAELNKIEKIYKTVANPDSYIGCLIAQRATNMKLLNLLTEEVDILDADKAGD